MVSSQNVNFEYELANLVVFRHILGDVPRQIIEEALAKPNVDLNYQTILNGDSFLCAATGKCRADIVQLLIKKGADVTIRTNQNQTALDLAESLLEKNPNSHDLRLIKQLLKIVQPGPSTTNFQRTKRLRDDDQKDTQSPTEIPLSPSPPVFDSSINAKRVRVDNEYEAAGLKLSLHGIIFQLRLLMLFAHRARANGYQFRLGTEMSLADKFDDVVLRYSKPNESINRQIFLQAKHRSDADKNKISANNLESTSYKDGFSLLKYLIGFCKIKNNSYFDGADLSHFFIVTNADFDFFNHNKELKGTAFVEKWKSFLEEETNLDQDDILYFENDAFQAKKYKLRDNATNDLKKLMKINLLKSALETKHIKSVQIAYLKIDTAVKLSYVPDLIGAKNQLKSMIDEKKVTKSKVIEMANQVERLEKNIFGKSQNTKLESALKKLKYLRKRTSDDENDLSVLKENVLDECQALLKDIENEMHYLNVKLKKFKDENANEFHRLENEKLMLRARTCRMNEKIEQISTTDDLPRIQSWIDGDNLLRDSISQENQKEFQSATNSVEAKEVLEKEIEQSSKKIIFEAELIEMALNDAKFEENFNDFLDKFRFVVNYPDEEKLGALIKSELAGQFNLLNADLVNASFEQEMLDFFKKYDKGTAEFYSHDSVDTFFNELHGTVESLVVSGLSRSYPEKLRGYGIRFKENFDELYDFLSEGNENQIFQLFTQSTRLGAIKVLQTLDATERYTKGDSVIFMRLRTLLRRETQQRVLSAFEKEDVFILIVIEVQKETIDSGDVDASITVRKLLGNRLGKKIIVIDTIERFYEPLKYVTKNYQFFFEHFDEETQEKCLGKEVRFQGRITRLNQLMNTSSAQHVFRDINLSKFLNTTTPEIGDEKAFSSIGYVKDYYIGRKLGSKIIKKEVFSEKSELFFITGADKRFNKKYGREFENGKTYEKGIVFPSPYQSDHDNAMIFEQFGQNAHWLEWHTYDNDYFFIWKDSKRTFAILNNYIANDLLSSNEEYFCRTLVEKVIIVANDPGMGKSTVLTSIAKKMKKIKNNSGNASNGRWIVRINLNDYSEFKHPQSLNKIDFGENDTKNAIEFVTKMAIPADAMVDWITQFQRKLFELSLKTNVENDDKTPEIVILFDGFDEISPNYKEKTTTLIKALKASRVIQMWVTTRVHEKVHLEQQLGSMAIVLFPLSENDQLAFSNKLWKWCLKFKKDLYNGEIHERSGQEILNSLLELKSKLSKEGYAKKLNQDISDILQDFSLENCQIDLAKLKSAIDKLDFSEYVVNLNNHLEKSIRDKGFTVNPLQLKMLTEVIFAKSFHLPKDFGLFDLYDEFVSMKFDIYYDEKERRRRGNLGAEESRRDDLQLAHKTHTAIAVEFHLFDECKRKRLPNLEALDRLKSSEHENEKQKLARRGLLCLNEGRLEFIHRSFAEYFLSRYLTENVQDKHVQKLLVKRILIENEFKLVRQFFDCQLEKMGKSFEPNETTQNVIVKYLKHSEQFFMSNVSEGHHKIIEISLKAIESNEILCKTVLTRKDEKNNGTALDIAIRSNQAKMVQQLLDASLRLKPEITKNEILQFQSSRNVLAQAIDRNLVEIIEIILNFIKINETKFGDGFLVQFVTDPSIKHAFTQAVKYGRFELLKCIKKCLKKNSGEKIVLKLSQLLDRKQIFEVKIVVNCLEVIADDPETLQEFVLASDRYGRTMLLTCLQTDSMQNNRVQKFMSIRKLYDPFFDDSYVQQFLRFFSCINDHDFLDDLAILCIYGDARSYPLQNLVRLLVVVDNASEFHKRLTQIESNMIEVENIHYNLIKAIVNRQANDVEEILRCRSQTIAKALLLVHNLEGKTALHVAVEKNQSQIVAILLKIAKKFPRIQEEMLLKVDKIQEDTALHRGAVLNHQDCVRELLRALNKFPKAELFENVITKTNKHGVTARYLIENSTTALKE